MKVKMKCERLASDDGIRLKRYKKGEIYDIRASLATLLIKFGHAEAI